MTAPGNAAAAALFQGGMNPSPTCNKKGYPTQNRVAFFLSSHSSGSSSHTGRRCKARTMLHCSNSVPSPSHIVAYHSGLRRAWVSVSNKFGTAGVLEMQVA